MLPVAIRAATSPTTMASTTASTASSVMRGRRDTSGATSMMPRPQDEQRDQERPDGPEPVRERLEEAQERTLERPGGLRRDDARQRERKRAQSDDVSRTSHANLTGWRSVEPAAHWERALHETLLYRDFPAAASLAAGEAPVTPASDVGQDDV